MGLGSHLCSARDTFVSVAATGRLRVRIAICYKQA
jgi:hypothetical protein